MTREASAAMRALVEAFDAATCAEHEMVVMHNRCNEGWRQEPVEESHAARTALLAAIAAQEAATEVAQAEAARLRALLAEVTDDLSHGVDCDLGRDDDGVVSGCNCYLATIRAALKETP